MTEPVDLDPDGYTGTYKLVGGSLCLDFANLVSYRGTPRRHDWLVPPGNLARWARAAGAPTPSGLSTSLEPWVVPRPLERLRESVAGVFLAVAAGQEPDARDLEAIARPAAGALGRRTLRFDGGLARWRADAPTLPETIAADAVRILTDAALIALVRACPGCGWLFLDATRNHRRIWCDSADCGNRARQRRHYERSHVPARRAVAS